MVENSYLIFTLKSSILSSEALQTFSNAFDLVWVFLRDLQPHGVAVWKEKLVELGRAAVTRSLQWYSS